MIHDLMVPITGTSADETSVEAAIAMADTLGAHLAAVDTMNLFAPMPPEFGMAPSGVLLEVYEDLRRKGQERVDRLRGRLGRESISWEVRAPESLFLEIPRLMALHARYADLAVLGAAGTSGNDASLVRECFSALLFESGRPVLWVPAGQGLSLPMRHVVVAWKPTREGTRALHDAMPFLDQAHTVDVAIVDPKIGERGHGEEPGVDIAAHLARHGANVNVVVLPRRERSVATALMLHAAESGAHCIVAGGYGHSRLREWALGGTTRELLERAPVPVLFSH